MSWLANHYSWFKALHIIAVISWMAGLLYLPRLMVYHSTVEPGSPTSELFKVMERRLLRAIMGPAMTVTWIAGLTLLISGGFSWKEGWLHAKLLLVLIMTGFHHFQGRWVKDFAADRNHRPQRFYRIANEGPTLAMIAIVILVVVRPF